VAPLIIFQHLRHHPLQLRRRHGISTSHQQTTCRLLVVYLQSLRPPPAAGDRRYHSGIVPAGSTTTTDCAVDSVGYYGVITCHEVRLWGRPFRPTTSPGRRCAVRTGAPLGGGGFSAATVTFNHYRKRGLRRPHLASAVHAPNGPYTLRPGQDTEIRCRIEPVRGQDPCLSTDHLRQLPLSANSMDGPTRRYRAACCQAYRLTTQRSGPRQRATTELHPRAPGSCPQVARRRNESAFPSYSDYE
jgi:hypothetical protein